MLTPSRGFAERLIIRAQMLTQTTPTERLYWQQVFSQAQELGIMLHTARQRLDERHPQPPVDEATLRLWEWGLVLPEEVAAGCINNIVRWYIDRLRQQQTSLTTHLLPDGFASYAELNESFDHDQQNHLTDLEN